MLLSIIFIFTYISIVVDPDRVTRRSLVIIVRGKEK